MDDYTNEEFCKWYNEKYDSCITSDTMSYELSSEEIYYLWDIFVEEKKWN